MSDMEARTTLVKFLTGIKIYLLWYEDPYDSTSCDSCGSEVGITHKELVGVYSSHMRAVEALKKRTSSCCYKDDDHEIEERSIE